MPKRSPGLSVLSLPDLPPAEQAILKVLLRRGSLTKSGIAGGSDRESIQRFGACRWRWNSLRKNNGSQKQKKEMKRFIRLCWHNEARIIWLK